MNLPCEIKTLPKTYQTMLQKINTCLPAIMKNQTAFFKSQSQFMDNMLTVTAATPIRNLRQISAEINKAKSALDEAYFKIEKKKVMILKKEKQLKTTSDDIDKRLLEIDIAKLTNQIEHTNDYMLGAIRKISAYVEQYNLILKKSGKESFTEEDFEREESRYHIAKAFEQGLIAARSNGGRIDEGNHIYLHQIGINGGIAQLEVTSYLDKEWKLIEAGTDPTHQMVVDWLNHLMDKYEKHPALYAESKGMTLLDTTSLGKAL